MNILAFLSCLWLVRSDIFLEWAQLSRCHVVCPACSLAPLDPCLLSFETASTSATCELLNALEPAVF